MITYADTETHPITAAEPVPRLVVSGFCAADQRVHLALRDDLDPSHLATILEGDLVMAHPAFDALVWLRAYPQLLSVMLDALNAGRIKDLLLREKQIDHAYGARERGTKYNLGAVAHRRVGGEVDKADPWRLKYGGLDGVPLEHWPPGARAYVEHDVACQVPIYAAQELHADLLADQARQVRASVMLAAHGARGIEVDPDLVHVLEVAFDAMRVQHERVLLDVGLVRPKNKKPGAPLVKCQKLAKQLIEDTWPTTCLRTPAGGPALSLEALEALDIPPEHPLYAYAALGSLVSKGSTYLDPLRVPVVRHSYDPCVSTNRTSCYSPNLQNLPRNVKKWVRGLEKLSPGVAYPSGKPLSMREPGFRECLVARPGHVFVVSDWSMMELVTLAQTCIDWFGWSHLGDAIREGRDAHEELGSTIAGFDIRGHAMRSTYRTLAKAPNFGYPGGLGAERFVAWANANYGEQLEGSGIVIDAAFARTLKRHWLQQWPEMRLYHKRIGALSKPITMKLDRTGYVRGGMGFTDASNLPFQAQAAAAAKDAGWELFVLSVTGGLCGGWPVLLVHDEYVVEVPEERAHECAAIVERVMIGALACLCPDVPGAVETMILKRYTK